MRKFATPFKWLFAKKRRWIPPVTILGGVALLILIYDVISPWGHIHQTISDIKYRTGEKTRLEKLKEELKENEELWKIKDYQKYEFRLSIISGGSFDWEEGSHGRSSGFDQRDSVLIKVDNGTVTILDDTTDKILDDSSANDLSNKYQMQYPTSISDLYTIIHDILDSPNDINTPDLIFNISKGFGITDNIPPNIILPDEVPLKIRVGFYYSYGIPDRISIYFHSGNLDFFHEQYLITYEISYFYGYWAEQE